MKLFIIAICVLVAVTVFCIIGGIKSTDVIDELLEKLHQLPTDAGCVPQNAKEVAEDILSDWEEDFFIISIFHPHHHLDEVKEKMTNLLSYSGTDEYAEWRQAHASLEESLLHLKGLLEANADNVM